MKIKERISKNIEAMQEEMGERYWKTAASRIWFRRVFSEVLAENARGKLLDAGAGNLLYKDFLDSYCDDYTSLDVKDYNGLDFVQDIRNMELDSFEYDTVFCRNVLEHVEDPDEAMREISRVTKKGGKAIISVPHLSYLHNEPQDYYRFTEYGFRKISGKNTDFEITEVYKLGGLFSFLASLIYPVLLGMTYHLPYLPRVLYYPNYIIQLTGVKLDEITGSAQIIPHNYVFVLEKRKEEN